MKLKTAFLCFLLGTLAIGLLGQSQSPTETMRSQDWFSDQPASCHRYLWRDRIRWDSVSVTTFSWSGSGQLLMAETQNYNNGILLPYLTENYTYDGNGNQTERLLKQWNGSAYVQSQREISVFDNQDRETLHLGFVWMINQQLGNYWDTINGTRRFFTDSQNLVVEESLENWTVSGWQKFERYVYSYDLQSRWDTVWKYAALGNSYALQSRETGLSWQDFSQKKKLAWSLDFFSAGNWLPIARGTCSYVGADSDCNTESYQSGAWLPNTRTLLQKDSLGNNVLSENYQYNNGWQQQSGQKWRYQYDAQGRAAVTISQDWFTLDGYIDAEKWECFNFMSGLGFSASNLVFQLFPNPAQDRIQIQLESSQALHFALFDLQGRKRMEGQVPAKIKEFGLQVDMLEPGEYLLMFQGRQGFGSRKVLIQR